MDNRVTSFTPRESDKIRTHRKESNGFSAQYTLIDLDAGMSAATLRIYWPGSVAYACIWINDENHNARGAGKAGGGGYCKESAAAHDALADAGVVLESPIDGRGVRAIEDALEALAAYLDIKRPMVHRAHP